MDKCIKRKWGGDSHKFKPRYDLASPEWMMGRANIRGIDPKTLYEKHYVCDICVYCGKTIKREK
jgi:hypothetical protein